MLGGGILRPGSGDEDEGPRLRHRLQPSKHDHRRHHGLADLARDHVPGKVRTIISSRVLFPVRQSRAGAGSRVLFHNGSLISGQGYGCNGDRGGAVYGPLGQEQGRPVSTTGRRQSGDCG